MQVTIPHKLTKELAVARVKEAIERARPQLGEQATITEERWDGDTLHFAFTAQGQSISGTFAVHDSTFDLQAKLPLMLRMFEGRLEAAIKEQAAAMLGK